MLSVTCNRVALFFVVYNLILVTSLRYMLRVVMLHASRCSRLFYVVNILFKVRVADVTCLSRDHYRTSPGHPREIRGIDIDNLFLLSAQGC